MNESMAEFTMFGSQQKLAKLVTSNIDFNGTLFKRNGKSPEIEVDLQVNDS